MIGEPINVGFQGGLELSKAFLHVQVKVDLTSPLTPGTHITDVNEVFRAPFKYENVFHFCKLYGKIGYRVPIASMILEQKYATFELKQIPLVRSYR